MKTSSRSWLRAAFLAAVWALPGVWCAAHLLAHELHELHEHHEAREVASAGDRIAGMSGDHDHSHSHPVSHLAISTDGGKKLDTPALLTAAVDYDTSGASSKRRYSESDGHATPSASAASGPRAPPIS